MACVSSEVESLAMLVTSLQKWADPLNGMVRLPTNFNTLSMQMVGSLPQWPVFRLKLTKWICLCEIYPYRMTLVVLIIGNLVKKALTKKFLQNHPLREQYRLASYARLPSMGMPSQVPDDVEETKDTSSGVQDDFSPLEQMPIAIAFTEFVEKYVHALPSASRLLALDGDPAVFDMLMLQCVGDTSDKDDIVIEDIVGPSLTHGSDQTGCQPVQRNTSLSLLSYSFNLKPGLRQLLSCEMALFESASLPPDSCSK